MAAEVTPTSSRSTPKQPSQPRRRSPERPPASTPRSGHLSLQPSDGVELAELPPIPRLSPQDSVDFLLHPAELAKGRRAAENYLSTFRTEESRRAAEEMLETLATVISDRINPANVRSAPNAQANVVGTIGIDSVVVVVGRSADSSWYYVRSGAVQGWVFAPGVTFNGSAEQIPVVQ